MKRLLGFALGIAVLLAWHAEGNAATELVRVSDKARVKVGQAVQEVAASDVVFIGDTHDDSDLHAKQLEIIRALYAKNPQLAIGVEMFTSDSQRPLDDWTNGKIAEEEFKEIYARNWSYDWRLYRDIFLFARDNRIPMIALNVPKPIIAKVVKQGSKGLTDAERKELPPGPGYTLNPRQAEYLRLLREQAFRGAPPRFPVANFNEAQALRNDTIAYSIAKFREKSTRKVVVIAGSWHAIKNGAPESLGRYGKLSHKVLLPDLAEFSWLKPSAEDVDFLIPRGE